MHKKKKLQRYQIIGFIFLVLSLILIGSFVAIAIIYRGKDLTESLAAIETLLFCLGVCGSLASLVKIIEPSLKKNNNEISKAILNHFDSTNKK